MAGPLSIGGNPPAESKGPSKVLVSVVVPTRNRSALIKELIESLWKQTLEPASFEVIIADNCSSDDTAEMMKDMIGKSPCRLIYHPLDANRGPAHARNEGARRASGAILAFTDSDCRARPEWLALGLEGFARSERVAFVTGPVRDKPEQPVGFFSLPTFANNGENPMYPGCNVFYRATAFHQAGGFDESAYTGDVSAWATGDSDTDLALKLKELGHENVFLDDLIIYHQVWSLTPRAWLGVHFKALQIPGVMKRNPALRRLFWWGPFVLRENLFFYLAVLGILLGFFRWYFLLLCLPHLVWAAHNPEHSFSLRRLPRIFGRILFLTLRQAVICGCLVYGSIRVRALVL